MSIPNQGNGDPPEADGQVERSEYHLDVTLSTHVESRTAVAAIGYLARRLKLPVEVAITRIVVQQLGHVHDDDDSDGGEIHYG